MQENMGVDYEFFKKGKGRVCSEERRIGGIWSIRGGHEPGPDHPGDRFLSGPADFLFPAPAHADRRLRFRGRGLDLLNDVPEYAFLLQKGG